MTTTNRTTAAKIDAHIQAYAAALRDDNETPRVWATREPLDDSERTANLVHEGKQRARAEWEAEHAAADTFTEAQANAYAAYVAASIADLRGAATTAAFMNLIRVLTPRADSDAVLVRAHAEISAARAPKSEPTAALAQQIDALTLIGRAFVAQIGFAEDRQNATPFQSRAYFKAQDDVNAALERHQDNDTRHVAALRAFNAAGGSYDALTFAILPTIPAALPSGLPDAEAAYCDYCAEAIAGDHYQDAHTIACLSCQRRCEANAAEERAAEEAKHSGPTLGELFRSVSSSDDNANAIYDSLYPEPTHSNAKITYRGCTIQAHRVTTTKGDRWTNSIAGQRGEWPSDAWFYASEADAIAYAKYRVDVAKPAAVDTGTMHGPNYAELLRASFRQMHAAERRLVFNGDDWTPETEAPYRAFQRRHFALCQLCPGPFTATW